MGIGILKNLKFLKALGAAAKTESSLAQQIKLVKGAAEKKAMARLTSSNMPLLARESASKFDDAFNVSKPPSVAVIEEYATRSRGGAQSGRHVLSRGVPVFRAYRDWVAGGGRGLSSPSMYAIEATRVASSVKAGYHGPGDPGAYIVYRMVPEKLRIGKENRVFAIGADNGTGTSARLSIKAGDRLLQNFIRELDVDGVNKATYHLFSSDDTVAYLKDRFIEGLHEYLRARPDHPAMRESIIRELIATTEPQRGRWTSLLRGSSGNLFAPSLTTRHPTLADTTRHLIEDYIVNSRADQTGVFRPLSESEALDQMYNWSIRDARAHNRHGAPIVTGVPNGVLMPREVEEFMAKQAVKHPDTYAEFKKIGDIPREELPDYVPEVHVILSKPFDQLWPETRDQIRALERTWDTDGVRHLRGYPENFTPGPMDEQLPKYPTELDLQKQVKLRLADKGGSVRRETQQASKAGDPPRHSDIANFLATDKVPESIFGYPVVQSKENYTENDIQFFTEHPKAAGFYDLGGEQ